MNDFTSKILGRLPISLSHHALNKPIAVGTVSALLVALCFYHARRNRRHAPKLTGPPRKSFLFSATQDIHTAPDLGALFAAWEKKYGMVYEIPPGAISSRMLVVGDPKGIAHIFARDMSTYTHLPVFTTYARRHFGEIVSVQDGENHKKQRRALSNGFSVSAIQNILPIFLDSADRLTSEWNKLLESEGREGTVNSITMDVQKWMDYVSLDTIGKGVFSYDFQVFSGNRTPGIKQVFDSSGSFTGFSSIVFFLIGPFFPNLVMNLPSERSQKMKALTDCVREILEKVLAQKTTATNKSILGNLLKSETAGPRGQLSIEEIKAQMMIVIGGYDPIASTLTWCIIELARNPEIQKTLRTELEERIQAPGAAEVTYGKIMNDLPYLDAFISEVLRLHPEAAEVLRQASQDDTIPLAQPIVTLSGTVVDNIPVEKGTLIRIAIAAVNQSEALWGPDAGRFNPERWLEEKASESNNMKEGLSAYRHSMTFGRGPRNCPGKLYALATLKAVLSVIARKFTFEFPDGPETKLRSYRGLLSLRVQVVGEEGPQVPLIVRKV